MHPIKKIVDNQKKGISSGIYSVCSASKYVIFAAIKKAKLDNTIVLIESTCNQVNQFGGYTSMKPEDFKDFVFNIAKEIGFNTEKIILGGDHLGPNVWQNKDEETAMSWATEMVKQYVFAGYTKIHLDASMHLADDDHSKPLSPEVVADRGARLCQAAEEAYNELRKTNPDAVQPVYVIGTEVPTPGGMHDESEVLEVTKVENFRKTVELSRKYYEKYNLQSAWNNVVAVVVQPGVEFGNYRIEEYNHQQAKDLCEALKDYDNLVFEGHSTDYQTADSLRQMVVDGIAILKVGPALTFACREAFYALVMIEEELYKYDNNIKLSRFIEKLDMFMIENPANWQNHYKGGEEKVRFDRKYSLLDRSRYYYTSVEISEAIKLLIANLKVKQIPLSLISQYLPLHYNAIRAGKISNDPEDLIIHKIMDVLNDYSYATNMSVIEL